MTLQNRVTPLGALLATPARGLVYGNRGCLHDDHGRIRRGYAGKRWIACRLRFKGWHRGPLLQPGRFTELFFLDEATSFAAGTARARCADGRTIEGSASSGGACTVNAAPIRSMPDCMRNASTAERDGSDGSPPNSTICPTGPSSCEGTTHGWSSDPRCGDGPRPATQKPSTDRRGPRQR